MADRKTQYRVRLGLQVTTEQKDGYFHCRAYPVTIGQTVWEQRYTADNPECDSYKDIGPNRIRNCGDELVNGLRLGSLQVNSQGNDDDQTRHLYAWEVRYHDVYSIDARQAGQMYKTLAAIEKRIERLADKYGRATTFGQYIGRVAHAISADSIVFNISERPSGWHHKDAYQFCEIGDGISRIDAKVRAWVDQRIIGIGA